MWGRRSRDEFSFVEAGPTLGDRIADVWHGQGLGRFLRLFWHLLTLPVRFFWLAASPLIWWRHARADGVPSTRKFRHLFEALPAIAAAIAVVAVAGVVAGRESSLRDTYRIAAASAYQSDRPKEAQIYYERLFRLDGGTADTRLFLGLTLAKLGLTGEGEALIYGVANGDGGGDVRANCWVATKLLSDPKTLQDRKTLQIAYRHLLKAEDSLPKNTNVKLDLVKYHLALGETEKAIPKLAAAASIDPALNFDLARLYASAGQTDRASEAMVRAERHYRAQLKQHPDNQKARLLLATCVANAQRFEEAVTLLHEGLNRDPEGPFGAAIARIYVSAYDRHAAQARPDYHVMITALREALKFDPKSAEAAVRLATFGEPGSGLLSTVAPSIDERIEKQAREMLQGLLAAGDEPPAVHMALGLKAWRGKDLQSAQWHFERAYQLDPSLTGVANNLAWIMSHQPNGDLNRALAIIDPVVKRAPDVAHFRDTRGEIYLRLERWSEALDDLELALKSMRNEPRIHESLATVYDALEKPDIARLHRREASRIVAAAREGAK